MGELVGDDEESFRLESLLLVNKRTENVIEQTEETERDTTILM